MRKVLYGAACSLDGFIASRNDEVDWLQWSSDVTAISNDVWKTTDTVLMGRRTWEIARQKGTVAYPGVQNFVFARAPAIEYDIPNLTVVRSDAPAFVRDLKEQTGRDICVIGGGVLARSLFTDGLIDEVGLNVHPILLGDGIPMFSPGDYCANLELIESRPLQYDCFYLRYRIIR